MIDSLTIATIDTETVGLEGHVYDIAWCIYNKRGDIRICLLYTSDAADE